jgi:hypothetical protein
LGADFFHFEYIRILFSASGLRNDMRMATSSTGEGIKGEKSRLAVTAYELRGKPLQAYGRRKKRRQK